MKKFLSVLICIITLFISINTIAAFPNPISNIQQQGSSVTLNGYDTLPLKHSGETALFCTNFKNTTMPIGHTCTPTNNWSESIRAGVASIIGKVGAVPISGNAPANYYYGELAINAFLCKSGIDTNYTCFINSTSSTYEGRLGDYASWLSDAITVRDNYISSANISFSTDKIEFHEEDPYYVSNWITISKNFSDNFKLSVSSTIFEETSSAYMQIEDNKVRVVILKESVPAGSTITVNLKASISRSVNLAQNYSCDSAQSITPNIVESKTLSATATATGTITKEEKGSLTINKVDSNGVHLPGATITITGPNGYTYTYETDGTTLTLDNLEFGEYIIKEIKAPEGYVIAKEQKITLSREQLTYTVIMEDELTKVVISKLDATGKNELPGATLEIQDKDGKIVKYCGKDGNSECKWVSTDKPYEIKGLPIGTYYLIETIAPEGYVLSNEKIEFIVTDEAKVVKVEMKNELEVEVPNTLSSRSALLLTIAMFDIALGIGIVTYVKKNKIEQ